MQNNYSVMEKWFNCPYAPFSWLPDLCCNFTHSYLMHSVSFSFSRYIWCIMWRLDEVITIEPFIYCSFFNGCDITCSKFLYLFALSTMWLWRCPGNQYHSIRTEADIIWGIISWVQPSSHIAWCHFQIVANTALAHPSLPTHCSGLMSYCNYIFVFITFVLSWNAIFSVIIFLKKIKLPLCC